MWACVGGGFASHTVGLLLRGWAAQSCPLGNLFELLQFAAWSTVLLYFLIGPAFRLSLLGPFSALLGAGLGCAALFGPGFDGPRDTSLAGPNALVETHAALALTAYGVFGMLALTSAMYLFQSSALRNKAGRGWTLLLPSLRELDLVNRRLLWVGVAVYSVSVALGLFSLAGSSAASPSKFLKLAAATCLWLAYAGTLWLQVRQQLLARRLAWVCLALFGCALLALGPVEGHRPTPPASLSAP